MTWRDLKKKDPDGDKNIYIRLFEPVKDNDGITSDEVLFPLEQFKIEVDSEKIVIKVD